MELEQHLGFRSAFNFIPAGPYRVSDELRHELTRNGFEVGIHDHRHDGKLFRSERGFKRGAHEINRYLQEWGATGFRAGFMLRNLNWLHQLNVEYDCSTFDTDPFEFQPDGTGTIFPFWIPAPGSRSEREGEAKPGGTHPSVGKGYVELPYTLPQDSTLFLLLEENSPDIWLRKADWIASHGGMLLVNVHPDYIQFQKDSPNAKTYDYRHYVQLLEYLRERYAGEYWHALPRDVAAFVKKMPVPPSPHLPKRVCMVTHSFYETDNRITRYAESLAARGDHVDVFALRSTPGLPTRENINGVHLHRVQNRFGKAQRSKFAYFWPLAKYLFTSSYAITRHHMWNRYDVVHVHNMPDFLVFSAWYPKLTGAKLLLDIHDIVPEFYSNKFTSGRTGLTFTLLKWIERCSAQFADHVIISNHLWRDKFAARTGTTDRCSVFINNVDTQTFRPNLRTRKDGRVIILFPGGLQWHQGIDIALHAFVKVSQALPNAEFHIYGDGIMKPSLVALASQLGFNGNVRFFEPVRISQIASIMANADLGIVPKRADSFGNEAYSTKIMEFMSLGVPVVVSRTQIDQYYFNDRVVRFFESGNSDALAEAMITVLRDPKLRDHLTCNALAYSQENSW
ncbi:MAG TPA: glycosyltransferase, partial [Xanthobacteraceae bacterium]|nr:glycosyltransferase [Xanthobacteraceae bacterium]